MLQQTIRTHLMFLALGMVSLTHASQDNTILGFVTTTAVTLSSTQQSVSSLDGSKMYICSGNNDYVAIIDVETQATIEPTIAVGDQPTGIAISSDGTRLCVTNIIGNTVSVIDTVTNLVTYTVAVGTNPLGVAIKPDSMIAYVVNNGSDSVSVVDLDTGLVVTTITHVSFSTPKLVAINPAGTKAYVTNSGDITIINVSNNTVSGIVTDTGGTFQGLLGIAFSPDGIKAYAASVAGAYHAVSVIDVATDTVTGIVTDSSGPLFNSALESIVFSPDGSVAYVANGGVITMIDVATNSATANMSNPESLSFDAKWLALAQDNPLLYVTDNMAGRVVYAITFVLIAPPASIEGSSQANVFFTQTDYINVITWTAPESGTAAVAYNVYRDEDLTNLAGTVSATTEPLQFLDTNRFVGVTYNYYVTSLDADGNESAAINTSVTTQSV